MKAYWESEFSDGMEIRITNERYYKHDPEKPGYNHEKYNWNVENDSEWAKRDIKKSLDTLHSPGGTLTSVVNHPYGICCLTGLMFKGVHWGDMENRKYMSRNIGSPLSLLTQIFA